MVYRLLHAVSYKSVFVNQNYQIALLNTGYYTKVSNDLANFNGKQFNTNYIKLSNKLKLCLLQKFVYWL